MKRISGLEETLEEIEELLQCNKNIVQARLKNTSQQQKWSFS